MGGTGVIDGFLDTFARYIDSGFGLIHGDVGFLAGALIVIDVTLAFLFWTWGEGEDIIARLVRKTIQVGFFAFLIDSWNGLAKIVYLSFSGLGLKAAGAGDASDLLHPGRIAQIGIDAGQPLLDQAAALGGFPSIVVNFVQISVLLLAWAIVCLAFFIIAIQLFVTLIEFKLVTLAGFVLVPFGLFGRTAYLAERVLGNVMATGIKVLVLAVIIGIGSTIFNTFIVNFGGTPPTLEQVASVALASLTLLGLAIFGPGIAGGLMSGGPQLGAGSAIGTGLVVAGVGAAAGGALAGAAGLTTRAGASAAASLSRSAGLAGMSGSSGGTPAAPFGTPGGGGAPGSDTPASSGGNAGAPAWARALRRRQTMAQGARLAAHTLRSTDHGGGTAHISLEDRS